MQKVHIKKLAQEEIGKNIRGWFLLEHNADDSRQIPIIQFEIGTHHCIKLHSIDANGEVDASVLIDKGASYKDKDFYFHEFIILDDWDSKYIKKAGDDFIEKQD